MFLWRNKQNYPLIITKYPPNLFFCKTFPYPLLIYLESRSLTDKQSIVENKTKKKKKKKNKKTNKKQKQKQKQKNKNKGISISNPFIKGHLTGILRTSVSYN